MDSESTKSDTRWSLTGRPSTFQCQVLETLLQEWRRDPENKVLIFTKSVKLLDMLEYHLRREGEY